LSSFFWSAFIVETSVIAKKFPAVVYFALNWTPMPEGGDAAASPLDDPNGVVSRQLRFRVESPWSASDIEEGVNLSSQQKARGFPGTPFSRSLDAVGTTIADRPQVLVRLLTFSR
jgi:hypothetical protein